ncbi:MAG TPA: bifunctional YncE family protein/alkaline phosphatase family protein [Gemmatimonadales bacterium]|nr:bifunctional YncE family protein/alkaline phosphatase family protein [Gemmatimonadales bacterium]
MSRIPLWYLTLAAGVALGCQPAPAGSPSAAHDEFTSVAGRLPTGVTLDPAGRSFEVGDFPLAMTLAPDDSGIAVLLLNGWREQGIVVTRPATGQVLQRIRQPAAFLGLAFAPDGHSLYASGGNRDVIYRYAWNNDRAVLADSIILSADSLDKPGSHYPAGLAFSPDGARLYVAENLADSLAVIDVRTGSVVHRLPAGRYPYGVAVGPDGTVYVSVWSGFEVRTFRPVNGRLVAGPPIAAPRHPSVLLLNGDGSRLFVVSASTDRIAVVDTRTRQPVTVLHDPAPAGPSEGSTPDALTLSPDGTRLFAAEGDNDAIAVFDLSSRTAGIATTADSDRLAGRIPVEWYPSAVAVSHDTLVVANAKGGQLPGSNARHLQGPGFAGKDAAGYTLGQLIGTVSVVPHADAGGAELADLTRRVERANRWTQAERGTLPPIQHVIYIIKENRTYDQILGDMKQGDGDSSLVFFPRPVSPNHHALAERFGLYDRFFVNAEVSADGHNWSTAAYAGDYLQKTIRPAYGNGGRSYDYEGENRGKEVPDEDDVASPGSGYLWDLAKQKGITYRNYGEYAEHDSRSDTWHGVKSALRGHTDSLYPGWNLDIRDQARADRWIQVLQQDVQRGAMPALEIVRLPNDHTRGADPGAPTPLAYMADNDLALGRVIDALSHSPFWRSTAVFVVEDDAQDGSDHVDSHRSVLLVISPWTRGGTVHRFVNTTDVLATIESLLGLDQLSQFDFYGRPLRDIWRTTPDLTPYQAITPAQALTDTNPTHGPATRESMRLDFHQEDVADEDSFNHVLWVTIKGPDVPEPAPRRAPALEWTRSGARH